MDKGEMNRDKIVLIGSGNVATHLGHALVKNNFPVIQIYSKSLENAKLLGDKLKTRYTNNFDELTHEGTIYVICVKDDAIAKVVSNITITPPILIHTSGCTSLNVLERANNNFGVIYPLQTFSKQKPIDFKEIPLCIEGNNIETEKKLLEISKILSSNVSLVNTNQRSSLHLSAVFTCNFVNFMCTIGSNLLNKNNLEFELLHPLIRETLNKVLDTNEPFKFQTGPAIREDKLIIDKHLSMLEDSGIKQLYSKITELIIKEKLQNEL